MSALPPIADIGTQPCDVCFVPKADITRCSKGRELGWLPLYRSALLPPQPHDDDASDLVALWRPRGLTNEQGTHGNVHEFIFILDEKVMVSGIVGVEVGLGRIHRDLTQQAEVGELVQRVVHRGERHRHFGASSFLVKHFRRYMTVAFSEENPS